jgi:type IV pilus assembly protein PilA
MNRAKREPRIYGGHGMAIAGFVLSIVSVVSFASLGVIAAIAVPNMFAARRMANEAMAMRAMRTIASAELIYHETYNKYASLEELAAVGLIDAQLATGTKNGYSFVVKLTGDETTVQGFEAIGVPTSYRSTGTRSFFVDETFIIRGADKSGGPSSNLDAPVATYPPLNDRAARPADYREELVY